MLYESKLSLEYSKSKKIINLFINIFLNRFQLDKRICFLNKYLQFNFQQKMLCRLLILCLKISLIASLNMSSMFGATLNLSPNGYNINSIDMDLQGNFVVSYQTNRTQGLIAKITPTLQNISFTTVKGEISKYQQALNMPNTRLNFQTDVLFNQKNNSIYIYNSTTNSLQKQYDYTEPLKAFDSLNFQLGNSNFSEVIAITSSSVLFGMQYNQIDLIQDGTSLSQLPVLNISKVIKTSDAVVFNSPDKHGYMASYIYSTHNNLEIRAFIVRIQATFSNSTISYLTIEIQFFTSNILSTATPVVTFSRQDHQIYIQDQIGNHYFFHVYKGATTFVPLNFTNAQTLAIFMKGSTRYALQTNALFQASFNSPANTYTIVRKIDDLPSKNYAIAVGSTFMLTYVPQTKEVYTQAAAYVQFILPNFQEEEKEVVFMPFQNEVLAQALQVTNKALEQAIPIPGARRAFSPLFYFFACFDDMYLYQFHDRKYGKTMTNLFDFINSIENQKWALYNYTSVLNTLGISVQFYDDATAYQKEYQTYKYKTANHTEVGSQGLMTNCNNFFIVTVPLTIVGFVVFRILFKLLFNYPISLIFRKFDFMAFLFLLLFDGNIQQLTFYMTSQWFHLFHFNLPQKITKMVIVLFGFVLIMLSVAFCLVCYSVYKKLNRIIMDNNRNRLSGVLFLTLQVFFRNFYLGFLNSFLRITSNYYSMMAVLISSQVLFLLVFAISLSGKIYKNKSKMWIYVLINAFKISLLSTFLFDFNLAQTPQELEEIQLLIISLQLGVFMIGIVFESISMFFEIASTIKSIVCRKKQQSIEQKASILQPNKQNKTNQKEQTAKKPQALIKKNQRETAHQNIKKKNIKPKKHNQIKQVSKNKAQKSKKVSKNKDQKSKKVQFKDPQNKQKKAVKYDRSNLNAHFDKIRQYYESHSKNQTKLEKKPKSLKAKDSKKTHERPKGENILTIVYQEESQINKIESTDYQQPIFNKQQNGNNKKNLIQIEKYHENHFQANGIDKKSINKQQFKENKEVRCRSTKKHAIKKQNPINPLKSQ